MFSYKSLESRKFNVNQVLAYFIVLCIILSDDTMYTLIEGWPLKTSYFKLALCVFCMISVIASKTIYSRSVLWIVFFGIYFLIYSLFTDISRTFILYVVIPFLWLFLYIYTLAKNQQLFYLTSAFVYIVAIEAFISIFFYLLGTTLAMLPGQKDLIYEWADAPRPCKTYFYLYFSNIRQMETFFSYSVMRNTGIFPEAPGYSGLLTYAMVLSIMNLKENPRRFKRILVLLVIAMVTTLSTKGFVVLLIFAVGWYFVRIQKGENLKYVGIVAILACAIFIAWILMANKIGSRSYAVRLDDMFAELKAWRDNLIFGVGYNNTKAITQYTSVEKSNDGLSMGMTIVLAKGGIYLFVMYIVAAARYLRTKFASREAKVGLVLIVVIGWNFFVSNCGFSLPFLMFVCMAFCLDGGQEYGNVVIPFEVEKTNVSTQR